MTASPRDISVFIDPVSRHFLNDELFNRENVHNIDGAHEPYFYLRDVFQAQGIAVHTADYLIRGEKVNKVNVYFSLGRIAGYQRLSARPDVILSAFFTFEAPIVQPSTYRELRKLSRFFKRVYSYTTGDAVARFGCAGLQFKKFHIPYPASGIVEPLWRNNDRKFLTLLNYNRLCRNTWNELYTERLRALEFFSRFDEIDLYGKAWDVPPYRVGETWIPATLTRINRYLRQHAPFLKMHPYQEAVRKTWRGVAPSKYETQSRYTFTICYENMMLPGWLNENLFDCFLVGTVPIFLGPPDITDYVPEECFIDKRRFATYDELRAYLKSLSEKQIRAYKGNARDYLKSDQFKPFRKESFAELFTRAVEEDAGISLNSTLSQF